MRLLVSLVACLVIVGLVVGFTPKLRIYAIDTGFAIKQAYKNRKDSINDTLYAYIDQANKIENLKKENDQLKQIQIKYNALLNDNANLQKIKNIHSDDEVDAYLVRVLSYAGVGSYTKIWLDYDMKKVDNARIYGLIKDDMALGIALVNNNKLLGILNGDADCSYSVSIGESKAPGIVRFQDGQMLVDYIPSFANVKNDDEVSTSGLDGIFYSGIKVGKISNLRLEGGYMRANLASYVNSADLSYIWLIDTNVPQSMTLDQNAYTNDDNSSDNSANDNNTSDANDDSSD